MAKTRKPIDPSEIELPGKAKDARLLRAYAAQAGLVSVPLLERAFNDGSALMRLAAAEALAVVAPAVGERLVVAALATLREQPQPTQKAYAALVHAAVVAGTPATIELARAALLSPDGPGLRLAMSPELVMQLYASFAERLVSFHAVDYQHVLDSTYLLPRITDALRARSVTPPLSLRDGLISVLDDARARDNDRAIAGLALVAWDDDAAWAALSQRVDRLLLPALALVLFRGDPAVAFERLAPLVADRGQRITILDAMPAVVDPRWGDTASELLPEDPAGAIDVWLRIGRDDAVLALARGRELDSVALGALRALARRGDHRVAPIAFAWLARPQDMQTQEALFHAVAQCGTADDIEPLMAVKPLPQLTGVLSSAVSILSRRHGGAGPWESLSAGRRRPNRPMP